jgi:hypothetical protein
MKKKLLYLILILFIFSGKLFAGTGSAITSGNWTNPSTWIINGIARVPAGGDTLDIPSGRTVLVDAIVTITGLPVFIYVNGTLEFQTGKKIVLPCNSYLYVYPGGLLDPGNGGGNFNFFEICNSVV